MTIKDYIINNFKEDDVNTLRNTIDECIKDDDEETLPGMGVFLNLIWQQSNEDERKTILENLNKGLKKED